MNIGLELLEICNEIWVFGEISEGMLREIELAGKLGKKILYKEVQEMELGKAVEILRERVRIDRGIREQEDTPFEELGDYDRFCELNNLAIERVLDEITMKPERNRRLYNVCICLEWYKK